MTTGLEIIPPEVNGADAPRLARQHLQERITDSSALRFVVDQFVLPCGFESCNPALCHSTVPECADEIEKAALAQAYQTKEKQTKRDDKFNRLLNSHGLEQVFNEMQHSRLDTATARPLIALVDLDFFKNINDSLGHPYGDYVISRHGEKLRQAVRGQDSVGRVGGDELAVISNLDSSDGKGFLGFLSRISQHVELPGGFDGKKIYSSCSVGVAEVPKGASFAEAINRADQAMYVIKRSTRDGVAYMPATGTDVYPVPRSKLPTFRD